MRFEIKQEAVFISGLFLLVLITRLYFLGSSLWHDDAFNFVAKALSLAVDGVYQNAHTTGYPYWVVLLSSSRVSFERSVVNCA